MSEFLANTALNIAEKIPFIGKTVKDKRQEIANSAVVASDRNWSEEQAQKQMDFQEYMSNTAWQRGVEDMQKAGLNPALAYMQGGASSASGAQASSPSTGADLLKHTQNLGYKYFNSALQFFGRLVK